MYTSHSAREQRKKTSASHRFDSASFVFTFWRRHAGHLKNRRSNIGHKAERIHVAIGIDHTWLGDNQRHFPKLRNPADLRVTLLHHVPLLPFATAISLVLRQSCSEESGQISAEVI